MDLWIFGKPSHRSFWTLILSPSKASLPTSISLNALVVCVASKCSLWLYYTYVHFGDMVICLLDKSWKIIAWGYIAISCCTGW